MLRLLFKRSSSNYINCVKHKEILELYDLNKRQIEGISLKKRIDPREVFAQNELNLRHIGAFGFDYDYTLCVYKKELNKLIYNMTMKVLIEEKKYPNALKALPYDFDFAIRGLHFDIENSCLLKIDAFNTIQSGSVYRGRRRLTDDEILKQYNSFNLPDSKVQKMIQLNDLFSLPWAGIVANIVHYCDNVIGNVIAYTLHDDIKEAVGKVHASGMMYKAVMENIDKFVHPNENLRPYLESLIESKSKELFIISNSPFNFINAGMKYMIGDDWRKFFKYIIVSAKKPDFFKKDTPFRLYDENLNNVVWFRPVDELEDGKIYCNGNIESFSKMAKFKNPNVLYFGDHMFSDLADPILQLGWRTAAIVPELAREIRLQNEDDYIKNILWIEALTEIYERYQYLKDECNNCAKTLENLDNERRKTRESAKQKFNPQFGSLFRTYNNMTCFSKRLSRLADIYTSRVSNLHKYSNKHSFYARRIALPHEIPITFRTVDIDTKDDLYVDYKG
uniref:5'-nucleotidase domain-containing protein 3 n=1 Tax=Parastrongyloides trichosuri TaxID=131310 RepID=A0A0N4ZCR2_PARTI